MGEDTDRLELEEGAFEDLLRAILYRYSCPPPERLALYQLNLLSAKERIVIARHVRECPHCARELLELARAERQLSFIEKLRQAAQVFEAVPVSVPVVQGVPARGLVPTLTRFSVGELQLHLGLQPGTHRGVRTLIGRLVHPDPSRLPVPGSEVWLMRGDEAWATPLEYGGVFAFEGVEPGEYDVGLEWEDRLVVIRGVSVR